MQAETQQDQSLEASPRRLRIGDAIVCERRQSVTISGKESIATDLSWRFLMAIVDAAPAVISYADLSRDVWNHDVVSDETIAQRVRQVRRLLQDDSKQPTYIRTVRGQGYQLMVPVETIDTFSSNIARRFGWVFVLFTVLALLAFAYSQWQTAPVTRDIPSTAPDVVELIERANEYRVRAQSAANDVAIDLYEQALEIDPDNTDAMLGLSFSLGHLAAKYEGPPEAAARAAELADRVILKDAGDANAWAARGLADDARGRVSNAIDYYRRALELNPASGDLKASIAYLLQVQGKLHESLLLEAEALSRAAPSYFADFQIATALQLAGFNPQAAAWLERAERLRPDNVFLLEYKIEQALVAGAYDEAVQLLRDADDSRTRHQELHGLVLLAQNESDAATQKFNLAAQLAEENGGNCFACVATLAAAADEASRQKALQLLQASQLAIRDGEEWPRYRVQLAYLAAAIGNSDQAVELLQDAVELGYRDWQWLQSVPLLSALQNEQRFRVLIEQMQSRLSEQRQRIAEDDALLPLLTE